MDKQTKTNVKNLVLSLRDDFEKEIENRLSHIGIYNDREWKDGRSLPHLAEDELGRKELDKRRRVAAFIKREEKLGLSLEEATSEFIKECSYTWINRLLGLKCMECQGIIEEVITTRPEFSNRSRVHRDFRETHPDIASKADDGLTATLFSVFEEVTDEIKILFDPSNEYSLIIPRYAILKRSIEKINTELDYETYRADDFLGWVYQYFNSREKDRVFEEVRSKKKKIAGSDIINVTQLYTEKYMVHFLVENSLGAMWMEMYPDSHLSSNWEYFVKDPNNSIREPKPIKEITFLDPACGSGHFLLYAFDLYYDMYLEEGVIPREQIPDYILKYNLHGIDIDQRAIQLTALGLYMKAKSKNPDVKVQHMNLVSADAIMQDKEILEEFLQEFQDDKTAQKLIRTIWEGLENVRELGSLLKIEEQIDALIEQKKDKRLDFYEDATKKNWDQWKQDILTSIKRYYEKASQSFDLNRQMFANEAYKGVQILDLLEQKYDVVATNPPYMGNGNMSQKMRSYLKNNFQDSYSDLYAAFITRSLELVRTNGFISMISQQTFMFIRSYQKLRYSILSNSTIRCLSHLGAHAFEDIGGEKVNTVMYSIKKEKREGFETVFLRLIDSDSKQKDLIYAIKKGEKQFIINQDKFSQIEMSPFVYWASPKIFAAFEKNSEVRVLAKSMLGMKTSNNEKYIRFYWEIDNEKEYWIPIVRETNGNKYFYSANNVVNWKKSALDFYKSHYSAQLPNEKYWFKEGLTFGAVASKTFDVKILPPGHMADMSSNMIMPYDENVSLYLLAYLNSRFIDYLMKLLNPTVNNTPNDIDRLPYRKPNNIVYKKITDLANACIQEKKYILDYVINDREFKQSAIQWGYNRIKGD